MLSVPSPHVTLSPLQVSPGPRNSAFARACFAGEVSRCGDSECRGSGRGIEGGCSSGRHNQWKHKGLSLLPGPSERVGLQIDREKSLGIKEIGLVIIASVYKCQE